MIRLPGLVIKEHKDKKTLYMRVLRFIPVLIVMGIIFFLSNQPDASLAVPRFFGSDKIFHIIAYAALAAAAVLAVADKFFPAYSHKTSIQIIVFCTVYGISDEFHQTFIAGRTASVFDVFADIIGACLVLGVVFISACRKGERARLQEADQ